MTLSDFVDRALLVPFVVGGRDWDGWDCWGLVFVAYRELFDIDIMSLSDKYDENVSFDELNTLVNAQRSEWITTDRALMGDVSLYRISRYQSHVALVLPKGAMIHSTRSVGTAIERLDGIQWAKRHVEYFRHARGSGTRGVQSVQDGTR